MRQRGNARPAVARVWPSTAAGVEWGRSPLIHARAQAAEDAGLLTYKPSEPPGLHNHVKICVSINANAEATEDYSFVFEQPMLHRMLHIIQFQTQQEHPHREWEQTLGDSASQLAGKLSLTCVMWERPRCMPLTAVSHMQPRADASVCAVHSCCPQAKDAVHVPWSRLATREKLRERAPVKQHTRR